MVATELGCGIKYIEYEMPYPRFYEAYNWIAMTKYGYTRSWPEARAKRQNECRWVFDEANQNYIDFMETEKHRYSWKNNCWYLPKVKK